MRTKRGRREVIVFAKCPAGEPIRKLFPFANLNRRTKEISRTARFLVRDEHQHWFAPNHSVILPIENDTIPNVGFYRGNREYLYCPKLYERLRKGGEYNPDLILKMAYDKNWEMHAIARANGMPPNMVARFLKHNLKKEPEDHFDEYVSLEGLGPEILARINEG